MVVAAFLVVDKANQVKFFEKTFLLANVSLKVVFGMFFLTLSSIDVDFSGQKLWWRTYTTKEAFPSTQDVKLVEKKEFVAVVLDPKYETYIIYVISLSSTPLVASFESIPLNIYLFWELQIYDLIAKEVPIKISNEYTDFADVFFPNLAFKLPEHTGINKHTIKLVNG